MLCRTLKIHLCIAHKTSNTVPKYTCHTGPGSGLTVLLNTATRDYFYPIRSTTGYTVSVTNPASYVDENTGNVQRSLVPGRTEAFISLISRTVHASEEVASVQSLARMCMFENELPEQYGGHYSFNDCLTKCKIRNYIALCGCIPFNMPTNFPDFSDEMRLHNRCNLVNLPCLHKNKSGW